MMPQSSYRPVLLSHPAPSTIAASSSAESIGSSAAAGAAPARRRRRSPSARRRAERGGGAGGDGGGDAGGGVVGVELGVELTQQCALIARCSFSVTAIARVEHVGEGDDDLGAEGWGRPCSTRPRSAESRRRTLARFSVSLR